MTLKDLRKSRGKTQSQLAAAMGVSSSSVRRIENSEDPMVSRIFDYVSGLGGSLEISFQFPDGRRIIVAHPEKT